MARAGLRQQERAAARMVPATKLVKGFVANDDGAALIEYTVLVGLLLVVSLATIGFVGGWITTEWTTLNSLVHGK